MIKLYEGGAYLENGNIIPEGEYGGGIAKEEAAKKTIAYGILSSHNTGDSDDNLKIKFDKLISHDITYVGIIQTARASGLEKFPVPYSSDNTS